MKRFECGFSVMARNAETLPIAHQPEQHRIAFVRLNVVDDVRLAQDLR